MNIVNLKRIKYHLFLGKKKSLSIVCSKCGCEYEKIHKKEESTEVLKIIGLITNIR